MNGYISIDCSGLNILAVSAQTITGLYNQVKEAMLSNKPIICVNAVWGSGVPITPIQVFAIDFGDDGIYCTSSTLQIRISTNDSVTIYNMAPEQAEAKKSTKSSK